MSGCSYARARLILLREGTALGPALFATVLAELGPGPYVDVVGDQWLPRDLSPIQTAALAAACLAMREAQAENRPVVEEDM